MFGRGVTERVFVPNCSVQDVRLGMRLPRFGTPCDSNNNCQSSLFISTTRTPETGIPECEFYPDGFGSAPVVYQLQHASGYTSNIHLRFQPCQSNN